MQLWPNMVKAHNDLDQSDKPTKSLSFDNLAWQRPGPEGAKLITRDQ